MKTLVTFADGRTAERDAPETIEQFLEQSRLWCEKYSPTPLSAEERFAMDSRWLLVMQKLQPEKYPVKQRKKK